MNLVTDNEFHSFEHKTRKISVIHDPNIDLDSHALIKQNSSRLIVVSFQNLDKYGLKCEPVTYSGKRLYVHKQLITGNVSALYYDLTKKLTEAWVSLDDILDGPELEPETEPILEKEKDRGAVREWIKLYVGHVVDSAQEVERFWRMYRTESGVKIPIEEWTSIFQEIYEEDRFTGLFCRQ